MKQGLKAQSTHVLGLMHELCLMKYFTILVENLILFITRSSLNAPQWVLFSRK